jgi:plastocyanin
VTRRTIVGAAALVALLALCSFRLRAEAAGAPSKPATHTVTIDGARFTPAELTVRAGDTVVWVNKDILAHTATAKDGRFDSKVIEPGKSWRIVVKRKGDVPYTCVFHPMNGTLTVK